MSRIIAFFLPLLFLLPPWQSEAQRTIKLGENYYEEDEGIIYTKEFTIDLKLHTHGFSLGVNSGNLETFYLTNYFHIELGEIKHPKEFRQSFDFQPPNTGKIARSFIFGKQNNFFVLRGGLGQKRYLSEKAKRKGLAIGLSYEGGPALGLLKPYYLELKFFSEPGFGDFEIRSEKLTEETEEFFLDVNRIFGASPFSKGLGEIKVRPGLHGKAAVHFAWGAFDEFVRALEAGVMFDVFFQDIPIMAVSDLVENVENRPYFINLFLVLQLGKRW